MLVGQNRKKVWLLLAGLLLGMLPGPVAAFSRERAQIEVEAGKIALRYKTQSLFVLPQEKLSLQAKSPTDTTQRYLLRVNAGRFRTTGANCWQWQAPSQPGIYHAAIYPAKSRNPLMRIQLVVMVPAAKIRRGQLNGFRIGQYPHARLKNNEGYQPPKGFIEITRANQDTWVSPHFQLKQFLCKQSKALPQYILLDETLLNKLERILEKLNAHGYRCDSLQIMSGYRTPYYNQRIGNVAFSSHLWGRAADIFVDRDHNGLMDDLNRDGKINQEDAQVLGLLVDEIDRELDNQSLVGGLGLYEKNGSHGPFVHVDVRGKKARWGIELSENRGNRRQNL